MFFFSFKQNVETELLLYLHGYDNKPLHEQKKYPTILHEKNVLK